MHYKVKILGCVLADIDDVVEQFKLAAPLQVHEWALRVKAFMADLGHFPHRNPSADIHDEYGNLIRVTVYGKRRGAWRISYSIDDLNQVVIVFSFERGSRGPLRPDDLA